jgi:hypothetical protein
VVDRRENRRDRMENRYDRHHRANSGQYND